MLKTLSKTVDEIRAELFAHIESVQEEYAAKGWLPQRINLNNGVIRGLLEVYIYGSWQLYAFLEKIMQQAVPKTATGEWLDMHAESVNLLRRKASKATGYIMFTRDTANTANIKIEKNKLVRTKPDGEGKIYRYAVSAETVLQSGQNSVNVKAESEDYGLKTNATVAQICELVTPINGIAQVTNAADWLISEAADDETDKELAARYIYQWKAKAGVTADAYKASALSVTGASDVFINDKHPRGQGTVDVYILGTAGLPTQNLLNAVKAAIANDIIINDDVEVLAPVVVNADVTIEIELNYGSITEIKEIAENYIRAYFKTLLIGDDIILDRMFSGIINIAGVKKINRVMPLDNIEIPDGGIAFLESIEVSVKYAEAN